MLSVLRVHLPSEIPIVGCEITPYVLVKRADGTVSNDDVSELAPLDGRHVRYRWYRGQSDKKVAICSVHPTVPAAIQCLGCLKAKLPLAKSYHCSPRCFSQSWQHHRALHDRASSAVNESGAEDEELFGKVSGSGSGGQSTSLIHGPVPSFSAAGTERSGGEAWFEVGCSRAYTPTADDIGHVLKFECVVVDAETRIPLGAANTVLTAQVIPAPSPTPRRMIPVNDNMQLITAGTFNVLSYNILADSNATSESYSYCPSWALSWSYRRQNLLREIVGYHADIVCLQEVQNDHFEEFFAPELDKHGYHALYKKKTAEVYSGNSRAVDGCATFFRKDRFLHVKKYEVEFNKAAQSLTDAVISANQKKGALSRLIKDNVALIVVLEAKFNNHGADNPGKRQLLCVANTHVSVPQECKDVKLWQVHTLLKGLEKIAASADIPMLVCGDFNSIPNSAPHTLLSIGKVDPAHLDLLVDPYGVLRPNSKLSHNLVLVSAYSSFARTKGIGLQAEQRRRVDPMSNEPFFTKYTRDYIGTVDYIFYTADSLTVESLLELLDEESLRKDTALPSPEWSSDHIALRAEFRWTQRSRR